MAYSDHVALTHEILSQGAQRYGACGCEGLPSTLARGRFVQLSVLGGFELSDVGANTDLPAGASRVLAMLAIADRAIARSTIAGTLWPDATEAHAQASLRSTLTRLTAVHRSALIVDSREIALAHSVSVDLRDGRALAHRLVLLDTKIAAADMSQAATLLLSDDLLPDWYDDWLNTDAQQWRELRFHALQALALRLAIERRYSEAADAAYAAIAAEPLRETGHAALIRVHLAEGNRSAAHDAADAYRLRLQNELNAQPSAQFEALLQIPLTRPAATESIVFTAQTAVAGEAVNAFEVVASGISMEPTIRHGDTLLVSRDVTPSPGRIVVAIHAGTWIVKRLAERDGVTVLRSDNVNEEVLLAEVEVRGVVVELRRAL